MTCEYKTGLHFLWPLVFSILFLYSKPHLIDHQILRDIRIKTCLCHVAALCKIYPPPDTPRKNKRTTNETRKRPRNQTKEKDKTPDYQNTNTSQHHQQTPKNRSRNPKSSLENGQHNTNNTRTPKQKETKEVHSDQALFFGFPCLLSVFPCSWRCTLLAPFLIFPILCKSPNHINSIRRW